MDKQSFELAVARAIEELPDNVRSHILNLAIVVEDWPDEETLELADVDEREELLGFYYGIPLTERTHDYGLVAPDKVSIFRRPIELSCANDQQVLDAIRRTVRHEIGHYFGLSDDRLEDLGAY